MTAYRTCLGCRHAAWPCERREQIRHQIAGIGLTSIKFPCQLREATYRPGDLVTARLPYEWDRGYDDGVAFGDFPGVVISVNGERPTMTVVFIAPGTEGVDDTGGPGWVAKFQPKHNGRGFCKINALRLKPRDGERPEICTECGMPHAITGHDDSCRHNPNMVRF